MKPRSLPLAAATCLLTITFGDVASADPPCWAPAHGYRAKTGDHGCAKHAGKRHHGKQRSHVQDEVRHSERAPYAGGQSGDAISAGGLIGAAVGGYAGSHVGKGTGRLAATAGGAVAGYVVGQEIERELSEPDR